MHTRIHAYTCIHSGVPISNWTEPWPLVSAQVQSNPSCMLFQAALGELSWTDRIPQKPMDCTHKHEGFQKMGVPQKMFPQMVYNGFIRQHPIEIDEN